MMKLEKKTLGAASITLYYYPPKKNKLAFSDVTILIRE